MSDLGGRLDTWKQIGDYLGQKNERTARRWAAERGLPVHRVPGGKRPSVYALKSEIDVWLQRNEPAKTPATSHWSRPVPWAGVSMLVLIGVLAAARSFELRETNPPLALTTVTYLTNDGMEKTSLRLGGNSVSFMEASIDGAKVMSVPADGGPEREIPTPAVAPDLRAADPVNGLLLVEDRSAPFRDRPSWILSPAGAPPRPLDPSEIDEARWSPDGKRLAFTDDWRLYLADRNGGHAAKLLSMTPHGADNLVWSPEGDKLRFLEGSYDNLGEPSAWELTLKDGTTAKPIKLAATCCEAWDWTRGGFFYLTKPGTAGGGTLWMIPRGSNAVAREISLPPGTKSISGFAVDWGRRSVFLLEDSGIRGELLRVDGRSGQMTPFLPDLSAEDLDFSPDGQWITYIRRGGRTLWRSRADGSDALQLAQTPVAAELPRWSPDGSRIAFTAAMPGRPERIFLVSRDGGAAQEAVPGNDDQGAPTWSPDGRSIAYGNLYCGGNHSCAIHIARLANGQVETLPGSQGLRTARWSPDGRSIAALTTGTRQIRIFDLRGRHWRTLAGASYSDNLAWSRDSTSLYAGAYNDPDPEILRIRLADGERTPAVHLASLKAKSTDLSAWFGLAPDGSLILLHFHRASEIVRASAL